MWQTIRVDDETDSEPVIAASIVTRLLNGDESAAHDLVQRYTRGLRIVLRSRVRNAELAKDLAQDTLLIAIEKIQGKGLEQPEKLQGWLHGVAKNLAMAALKKGRRENQQDDPDRDIPAPDDDPGPAARLSRDQVAALVHKMVGELPLQRDREILIRTYFYDQDKEVIISEVEGLDSAADYHRVLHRAKARLRKMMLVAERREGLRIVPPRHSGGEHDA